MKITVIGAGPGGYEAAIMAAKLGAEVTVVEKATIGGTCLNLGCIPTKALLASSEVLETVKEAKKFGVFVDDFVAPDFKVIMNRKAKIVNSLVKGIDYLFKVNKVKLIKGLGKLVDKNNVEVTKEDGSIENIVADKIILATGSVPIVPKQFKLDGKRVINSDHILKLDQLPKSMMIVGGGVIGCEIGQFLSRMGTKVTIIEKDDQLLPLEDVTTSKQLARQFRKDKIKVITGNGIVEVDASNTGVIATLQNGKIVESDHLLVAIGRRSYVDNLNAQGIGVEVNERGQIIVNNKMETNIEGVYAIGDIVATPLLAHVASKEGIIAVRNAIKNTGKVMTYKAIPRCVYTDPEVASVGLTERDCKTQKIEYKIGQFDFRALGKAQIMGKIQGFVKVIVNEKDVIIGATIVGSQATDLLAELTLAVYAGLTAEMVGSVIHPHPTLSEAIMEALHDVHGESINKVR